MEIKSTDEEVVNALEEQKQYLLEEQRRTGNSPEFQCLYITGIAVLEILDLIQRQKAEIERLTELQSRSSYRVAELGIENAELQKQVDERENEIDRLEKVVHEQSEQYYNLEQRTAVEILQKGRYCMPSGLRDWICERYGVEVER